MKLLDRTLRAAATAVICTLATSACGQNDRVSPPPSIAPHSPTLFPGGATFGEGWSWLETDGELTIRWMARRGEVHLPPAPRWSSMRLFVELVAPLHILARRPTVRIVLDGVELDRFSMDGPGTTRTYVVPARSLHRGVRPELVIETSETAEAQGRTLGVALQRASWDSVGGAT